MNILFLNFRKLEGVKIMIRIQDYECNNRSYEIYLTKDTQKKAKELGFHNGVFLAAAARTINRLTKRYNTYYYAEHNILINIEADSNRLFFLDIKRLNIYDNKRVSHLKDPINDINQPGFFKSYEDGRKVYLNEGLPLKMKKMSIPPHLISLKNITVADGSYSMFENDVIIDFEFKDKNYYITNVSKPDFVNFGLAVLMNTTD